ncbi:MAG: SMC-Scp complex subunit ScpB [Spirochaetota bacterium]
MTDDMSRQAQLVEAVLFLENESMSVERIAKTTELTELDASRALEELSAHYAEYAHGMELIEQGGEYLFMPKKHLWEDLKEHYGRKVDRRLTKAALETLSIIAYSQPITKKEIDSIRGVSSETIIKLLRDKDFIQIVGHRDSPGRPILYGTTKKFLKNFNLSSISSLPRLSEIDQERFEDES